MDEPQSLEVDSATWPALVFAIRCMIDGLELRARVAGQADPVKGPEAAREYREDVERLQRLLPQLGVSPTQPDPGREAVRWLDGVYTAVDGEPMRMVEQPDLQRLIDGAVERHRSGSLTVADLLEALADATGLRPAEVIRRTALARASLDDEQRPRRLGLDTDLGLSPQ